jgi:hypothetical protein
MKMEEMDERWMKDTHINQLYKWMNGRRTTSQGWMKGMGGR